MTKTPILQFGTSRFLQAHADLFVSQAREEGQEVGPITIVQSSGDASRAARLRAFARPFPVRIEGLINGARVQKTITVGSVARGVSTSQDWAEVARIFVEEAQIVLSNTGDRGFAARDSDHLDAFDQSMSYPAKLTHLLRIRFARGAAPIQIMPMELVPNNGQVLKARVMDLAKADPPGFRTYLDTGVTWVNSLVDRIVSQPIEPVGAVAEPYALWAIEDQPGLIAPCIHPAIQIVPSLDQIEALKLFVLNLSHTFLAERWLWSNGSDGRLVREMMEDLSELARLQALIINEVRPAFVAAGLTDAFDAYLETTLERFANPYLDHRIADIAQNHPQKVARRMGGFLDFAARHGDHGDKPILSRIMMQHRETV
ncbi:mannitol dehydrogenase family protein [Gymnodinialimonas sp. 2305UL16-5]|uniref:mannitol dehydrogenase family protein n=1 Tax=Gymnodinialimonas mytili TaxID=3126503 RepID=UPI0030A759EE